MAKITYENKEKLNENSSIANKNKGRAEDWNEIKLVINETLLKLLGLDVDNWSSSVTYSINDTCCYDNKIFINKTGTNTTTRPSEDTTNWEFVAILTSEKKIDKRLMPDIYSTDEVKTNEIYIDGNGKKWPIYQKMFVTSVKTFNAGTYELGTLDNTCLIMKWYPTFINSSSNAQFQMSNPNTELYHQSGKVSVNFKTNWGSGHVELIVKYRKTTD